MERSPSQSSQQSIRWAWKWAFGGCVSVLVVVLVVVIAVYSLMQRGEGEFSPIVEEFLSLVEQEKYRQAYDALGDHWKETDSFEEFRSFVVLTADALGPLQSIDMTSVHYSKKLGSSSQVAAKFNATFEKGTAELDVTLRKYDGVWKLEGLHYKSDAITSKLKCPNCGTVNSHDANHCGKCGTRIEQPDEEEAKRRRGAV